jgi:hypothetical protein
LAAMSTSGEASLRSSNTNAARMTTAAASSPIVRGDPHPHPAASLSGSSRQTRTRESRTAGEIEPARAALFRFGEQEPVIGQRQGAAHDADPEQQVIISVLADEPGDRQRERPAEPSMALISATPVAARDGQRHGGQADAERHGRQRQAGHAAADDQRNQAVAQRTDKRAERR